METQKNINICNINADIEELNNEYVLRIFLSNKKTYNDFLNRKYRGKLYHDEDQNVLVFEIYDSENPFIIKKFFAKNTDYNLNFFKLLNQTSFKFLFYFEYKTSLDILGSVKVPVSANQKVKKEFLLV